MASKPKQLEPPHEASLSIKRIANRLLLIRYTEKSIFFSELDLEAAEILLGDITQCVSDIKQFLKKNPQPARLGPDA